MKKIFLFCLFISEFAFSEEVSEPALEDVQGHPAWKKHTFDFETGLIWNVRSNTPIPYRIVPTQLSWRSPYMWKLDCFAGSKLVLRNQVSLIVDWVQHGPEDYYFGLSAAPSFEWWCPKDVWSLYFSIGGGFGVTNSTDVVGGQGQDFTYNWFSKSGIRYEIDENVGVFTGVYFQHLSNRGATDPNPGIDALGITMGVSYTF